MHIYLFFFEKNQKTFALCIKRIFSLYCCFLIQNETCNKWLPDVCIHMIYQSNKYFHLVNVICSMVVVLRYVLLIYQIVHFVVKSCGNDVGSDTMVGLVIQQLSMFPMQKTFIHQGILSMTFMVKCIPAKKSGTQCVRQK